MHTCAAILSQISGDVDDANQFIYFLDFKKCFNIIV